MSTAEQACNWPQCLAPRRKDGKCFAWCKCRCHSREARLATPAAQPEVGLSEHLWIRDLRRYPEAEVRLHICNRLISGTLAQQVTASIDEQLDAAFEAGRAAGAADALAEAERQLGRLELHNLNPTEGYATWAIQWRDVPRAISRTRAALRAESGTGEGACPVGCAYPKPCECRDRLAAVATHTRTSTHGHGPDYCGECSAAVSDWVQWPCPGATR